MIQDLELGNENPSAGAAHVRERYAKTALLQFYPYRDANDLLLDGSYWKLFMRELSKKRKGLRTKFWDEGFSILQNVNEFFGKFTSAFEIRTCYQLNYEDGNSVDSKEPGSRQKSMFQG